MLYSYATMIGLLCLYVVESMKTCFDTSIAQSGDSNYSSDSIIYVDFQLLITKIFRSLGDIFSYVFSKGEHFLKIKAF